MTKTIKFGLYRKINEHNEFSSSGELEAISDTEDKLKDFCKTSFGKEINEEVGYEEEYFIIKPFSVKVV